IDWSAIQAHALSLLGKITGDSERRQENQQEAKKIIQLQITTRIPSVFSPNIVKFDEQAGLFLFGKGNAGSDSVRYEVSLFDLKGNLLNTVQSSYYAYFLSTIQIRGHTLGVMELPARSSIFFDPRQKTPIGKT